MISVAVPTRHRLPKLQKFVDSFIRTTTEENRPHLLIVSDAPEASDPTIEYARSLHASLPRFDYIRNHHKKGLATLWNQCIYTSPTDWTLVCNDDAVFQDGWLAWLTEQISSGKYLQVNLLHYGGFCISKRMILKNGWFDERFRGGGFEDNDWQLRVYEGGLYSSVYNWPIDWKYMLHEKVNDGNNWRDENNYDWMAEKWGKNCCWGTPAFRQRPEIDWHPFYTSLYERTYGETSRLAKINSWVGAKKPAFHG
jgi:glycosyltransferase involved in cell wall biosynthesis